MKNKYRPDLYSALWFTFFSFLAIEASAQDLSAYHFNISVEARSENKGCYAFAKVKYPTSYQQTSRSHDVDQGWEKKGEYTRYEFPFFDLDQATCDQFKARQITYFGDKYMGWYKNTDFVLDSELPPIKRWENRFVFLLEDPIYRGPVEYSKTYREREQEIEASTIEIATFQEANVKNHTFIFTKDAKMYIRHTASFWKLFLSPTHLVAIDPTGAFLPLLFPRPTCLQDDQGLSSCAFSRFNKEIGDLEILKGGGDSFLKIGTSSESHISITSRPYGVKWKHDNASLDISATFDAPVRPVFFEKGVLFTPHAKPNRKGNYKKTDMLPYRVCVADCPEHIKLQQENTSAE